MAKSSRRIHINHDIFEFIPHEHGVYVHLVRTSNNALLCDVSVLAARCADENEAVAYIMARVANILGYRIAHVEFISAE